MGEVGNQFPHFSSQRWVQMISSAFGVLECGKGLPHSKKQKEIYWL
jgi:hypothetical protein